jgi:transposase-like protein
MKVCRNCFLEKPLDCFYKHAAMQDGYLNKCIDCVKQRVAKHRLLNLDRIKEYDKKRSMFPHRVAARKEYQKTEQGRLAKQKAMTTYKQRYPLKLAAHIITRNYIRDGKLIQASSCSVCGSTHNIEGHHDDYTKPLEVRWLCVSCHKKWHRENTAIYI